jgi:hypothetical protein
MPPVQPTRVDYTKSSGVYYVQDVYTGWGARGIERGTVAKLRVIALEFRAAGVGHNNNGGAAGGALVSTPIAVGQGAWDVKRILGDAAVHPDGSAYFSVPARTPVYFQLLDEKNRAVQTMRSWSTLQPGEVASCVGCHDDKNGSPPVSMNTIAMKRGPQVLEPFHGEPRGFSFEREIQPILDRHCISCHDDRNQTLDPSKPAKGQQANAGGEKPHAFSLLGATVEDVQARRRWSESYLALTNAHRNKPEHAFRGRSNRIVNWLDVQSAPSVLPPGVAGAVKSELIDLLERGHYGVTLSRAELDKFTAWIDLLVPFCGDYAEAAAWSEAERAKHERFMAKRRAAEAIDRQSIEQLLGRKEH